MKQVARYGSWRSPISADFVARGTKRISEPLFDGEDIYWLERRPVEKGRSVVVRRRRDGTIEDILPAPFNARNRVHEYGGGSYTVHNGIVFFTNYTDQRIYRFESGTKEPVPITPDNGTRYADLHIDPLLERLICACENHDNPAREADNYLVSVAMNGSREPETLDAEHDFYSTPRLSPDGRSLAWLQWDHPNMPWDGCELMLAELDASGRLTTAGVIAGGKSESIFQPEWSPDGSLHFESDRTGWWNLYRYEDRSGTEALCPMDAEFGLPNWVFGMATYAFVDNGIFCVYCNDGLWNAAVLDESGTLRTLSLPYVTYSGITARGRQALFVAGLPDAPPKLVLVNADDGSEKVEATTSDAGPEPGYLAKPEAITFPSSSGRTAHAFYYPPVNKDFEAPPDDSPPLIVKSHGGPTGATDSALDLQTQFWTSRGFGVLDVNYGGSSGFGRAYRELLRGNWGIVDVQDCAAGARSILEKGWADPDRLAITGGSAGGYTTLCALTFTDVFKAGASYYGVSDLEALTQETHKFESRYLDGLVGPYPEREDLYRERSPIHHSERLNCPVIFFQGLEDEIVPPNQAEIMVQVLREKGIPVALIEFEDEQHGFRQAQNIRKALESEFYFYSRVFGFEPADSIEPVPIDNLDR